MPKPRRQMSKYGVPASAPVGAAAASLRLGKRKLKVRIVESSEDSDVEDIIEQTGSVSLNAPPADVSASAASASASDEEPTYHELARTAQPQPQPQQQRKKREIVITDELREHMDDTGIRCRKCGVKTKNVNIVSEQIRGKSEGKSRSALRADCSKCGGRKFAFGKLAE
jgi:ribosomal protein L37E